MNENIERILYIGFAVVLLGIAFSFFFANYNSYRGYAAKGSTVLNEDRIVVVSEGEIKDEVKGTEVVHQVLEVKRLEEYSELFDFYSDSIVLSSRNYSQIWVSGINAIDIDTLDIECASYYSVEYEKDYSGQIIKTQYTLN